MTFIKSFPNLGAIAEQSNRDWTGRRQDGETGRREDGKTGRQRGAWSAFPTSRLPVAYGVGASGLCRTTKRPSRIEVTTMVPLGK